MPKLIIFAVVILFLFGIYAEEQLLAPPKEFRKKLAGPPSEFESMALPNPKEAALLMDSALIPFSLKATRNGQVFSWAGTYPVDTETDITIALLSPIATTLELYLKPAGFDTFYHMDDEFFKTHARSMKSSGPFGIDGNVLPSTSYTFYNVPIGDYELLINTTVAPDRKNPGLPDGYLLLDNDSDYKLESWLNTLSYEEGEEIGLTIDMVEEDDYEFTEPALRRLTGVITQATLSVILPDGNEVTVPMKDDGMNRDLSVGDGVYGATVEASKPGQYIYQAQVSGITPEGKEFYRTSAHIVQVVAPQVTLTGLGKSIYDSNKGVVLFQVDVDLYEGELLSEEPTTVRAYAQVWGTDASGIHYVPVAWVESMVDAEVKTAPYNGWFIEFELDERWVKNAKAQAPFQLRNVVLQDRNTFAVLSERKEIYIQTDAENNIAFNKYLITTLQNRLENYTGEITSTMLWGRKPNSGSVYHSDMITYTASTAGGRGLLLVHGYCSGKVWPEEDFTNAYLFQDHGASRSNDQFALLIIKFAEQNNLASFGVVCHSQGGLASLHLLNTYWSGLDASTGGRKIQSVGSPYKGCSLAGSLASIGSIFGVGCSSNTDLTTTGAVSWLAGMANQARNNVFYYTTTYPSGFLSSACVTGSGLVMKTPNDGTCELPYSELVNGNNQGNTEKQCHTSGMNYLQQTLDVNRNKQMNTNAAR